jgi:two-component system chemotaxis sensor kinase CheA
VRGADDLEDREAVQVVVYTEAERPVGLIVGRILDIVEQDSNVRGQAARLGVDCTAVIQGHVTEMLNVEALIRTAAEG